MGFVTSADLKAAKSTAHKAGSHMGSEKASSDEATSGKPSEPTLEQMKAPAMAKLLEALPSLSDDQLNQIWEQVGTNLPLALRRAVRAEMHTRGIGSATSTDLPKLREWADTKAADQVQVTAAENASEANADMAAPSIKDRPKTLDDMVGQKDLIGQLRMVCAGSVLRGTAMPHCLISGPAGFGKTTIAQIIAQEVMVKMIPTTGMMLRKPQDLVGLLIKIDEPAVLFIDEIHAMSTACQEQLYTALEDGTVDVLSGGGMDASTTTHEIKNLIVVGATTRPGLITIPMRDRFGFQAAMAPYSEDELAQIVSKAWERVGMAFDETEPGEVAKRCKGVPRRALHLSERVLDFVAVQESEKVAEGMAANALAVFGINGIGLDETDFKILVALTGQYAGRTVGMDSLAQALDMDARTLADQHEPYLLRSGLIVRAKSGRMATDLAYEIVKAAA